ncbi:MAG: 6-phosphogluconolactonase [Chloroflexi bacterium]|nr:MAG: 6-phosphogluconolactonase [Chloroflexota bacterium]
MRAAGHIAALPGEVRIAPDSAAVAGAAAAWLEQLSRAAVARQGTFSIALAGGSTPRALYVLLAGDAWRHRFEWSAWRMYFGDERACPPDDLASNYRSARETLLDHVPIARGNVHRMEAERADLDAAAAEYSALLASSLPAGAGGAPRLDCVLLGLGENGHTASLFPGTKALEVRDAWATRGLADYAPYDRMTLTFPTLNAAAGILFMATGENKREALRATAHGDVPASRVQPIDGSLLWLLDSAAAG